MKIMKKIDVLGVKIAHITNAEALEISKGLLNSEGVSKIFTPNPEIIMAAQEDTELKEILNSADLCTADGIGVVYASKILGEPLPERVAGFDLACSLLEHISHTGEGVFLFGAKPGVAEIAKAKLESKYPGIKVSGTRNGYFKDEDCDEIIEEINNSGAKLLLVCLGAPKQEKWIDKYKDSLKVSLCMGVGGTLDVLAGTAKRAPEVFIKLNLEWAYRFMKQPDRIISRGKALPQFLIKVINSKGEKK